MKTHKPVFWRGQVVPLRPYLKKDMRVVGLILGAGLTSTAFAQEQKPPPRNEAGVQAFGSFVKTKSVGGKMTLNHIHLQVRDLGGTIDWFEKILQIHPGFRNERMATFAFDCFILIVDAANDDAPATLGFKSDDCDRRSHSNRQPTMNGESEPPILGARAH